MSSRRARSSAANADRATPADPPADTGGETAPARSGDELVQMVRDVLDDDGRARANAPATGPARALDPFEADPATRWWSRRSAAGGEDGGPIAPLPTASVGGDDLHQAVVEVLRGDGTWMPPSRMAPMPADRRAGDVHRRALRSMLEETGTMSTRSVLEAPVPEDSVPEAHDRFGVAVGRPGDARRHRPAHAAASSGPVERAADVVQWWWARAMETTAKARSTPAARRRPGAQYRRPPHEIVRGDDLASETPAGARVGGDTCGDVARTPAGDGARRPVAALVPASARVVGATADGLAWFGARLVRLAVDAQASRRRRLGRRSAPARPDGSPGAPSSDDPSPPGSNEVIRPIPRDEHRSGQPSAGIEPPSAGAEPMSAGAVSPVAEPDVEPSRGQRPPEASRHVEGADEGADEGRPPALQGGPGRMPAAVLGWLASRVDTRRRQVAVLAMAIAVPALTVAASGFTIDSDEPTGSRAPPTVTTVAATAPPPETEPSMLSKAIVPAPVTTAEAPAEPTPPVRPRRSTAPPTTLPPTTPPPTTAPPTTAPPTTLPPTTALLTTAPPTTLPPTTQPPPPTTRSQTVTTPPGDATVAP